MSVMGRFIALFSLLTCIQLEASQSILDEIVVTAVKQSQSMREVNTPSAVWTRPSYQTSSTRISMRLYIASPAPGSAAAMARSTLPPSVHRSSPGPAAVVLFS